MAVVYFAGSVSGNGLGSLVALREHGDTIDALRLRE